MKDVGASLAEVSPATETLPVLEGESLGVVSKDFKAFRQEIQDHLDPNASLGYAEWVASIAASDSEQYDLVHRIQEAHGANSHLRLVVSEEEEVAKTLEVEALMVELLAGNLANLLDVVNQLKRQGNRIGRTRLLTEAHRVGETWIKRKYSSPQSAEKAPVYPSDILTLDVVKPKLQTYRPKPKKTAAPKVTACEEITEEDQTSTLESLFGGLEPSHLEVHPPPLDLLPKA